MNWSVFLSVLLCGLLSAQRLVVRSGEGRPLASMLDSRERANGQPGEEEELLAIRTTYAVRIQQQAPARKEPPAPVARGVWTKPEQAPTSCDTAVAHWRAVLLPPGSALDEEPPGRA